MDHVPRNILAEHKLIEYSIVKDSECDIEFAFMEQFFIYEGNEIYEDIKLRFGDNKDIMDPVTKFQELAQTVEQN